VLAATLPMTPCWIAVIPHGGNSNCHDQLIMSCKCSLVVHGITANTINPGLNPICISCMGAAMTL
jgi:hypothetical protein